MSHRIWYLLVTFALMACGQRKEPPAPVSYGTENITTFKDAEAPIMRSNSNTMLAYNNPRTQKKYIKPTEQEEQTIVVKSQENLDVLAKRYQISRNNIISRNNLMAPYYLFPGQQLKLPKTARARPVALKNIDHRPTSPVESDEASDAIDTDEDMIVSKKKQILKKGQQGKKNQPRRSVEDREKELKDKFSKLETDLQTKASSKAKLSKSLSVDVASKEEESEDHEDLKVAVKKTTSLPLKSQNKSSVKETKEKETKEADDLSPADSVAKHKSEKAAATTTFVIKSPLAGSIRDKIISDFNQSTGKIKNDGINIKAEKNTPILAAQSGQVVYAGNEMQGFGNLILLKHEDGWMTAYGHCGEILVQEKQSIKQGEMIAKVGNTGSVRDPQLHFQLRKKSTVVDPKLYLE